ncbi:capsule biosynthesis protein [Tateyamaria pelophila]|uniref:capsule biosynthesis protein n=1 Tax=Tateyamaria pelophila TaxID=328415 RepID=UPI001CBE9EF0|nr:capsule biosynthesis protein [Tateyamaria pelophila]
MTTKRKARKFRIKRSAPALGSDAINATSNPPRHEAAPEQPVPVQPPQAPPADEVAAPSEVELENTIENIRKEGLTGRQLRMARRVAQKHELEAESDFEAVRILRERGIDPFQRSNMLELVVPQAGAEQHEGGAPDAFANLAAQSGGAGSESGKVQLPQTMPTQKVKLPSTEVSPAERRSAEIQNIQRDITRRRRRKMGLLLVRLAFFVALPTFLAGYYFFVIATPMYSTKSEFMITSADNAGGGGLGSLLTGTPIASASDSIATQGYLQSKEAMLRLDQDAGFKTHFLQDWIDPIQRLGENPSNEEAYKTYKKHVKIGYDPTEGIVRMEVIAADPVVAMQFSEQLIDYAEERLNGVSLNQRENQMQDALNSFAEAEEKRSAAQEALVRLQLEGSTLDPQSVIASIRTQISSVETQVIDKEIELASLLNNARPNQSRVDGARSTLNILKEQLQILNNKMTDVSQGENSLAELTVRIQMAQADLATRDLLLQSALQQVEQTRVEANRQVRYLNNTVRPLASQEPSYPRAFENTILAFLVFAGIYLMISLTASILREQVTS